MDANDKRKVHMTDILRFKGDLRETIDRDQMLGPDFGRRYLAIKSVDYDPATDRSTVTLRGILPDEFRTRIEPIVAEQRERARIAELFLG